MVAFGGLGLLNGGVGALLLYGLALVALDTLRGIERWTYEWTADGPLRAELGRAEASFVRGISIRDDADACVRIARMPMPEPNPEPDPVELELARAVAERLVN